MFRRLGCALFLFCVCGCADDPAMLDDSMANLSATAEYPEKVKAMDDARLTAVVGQRDGGIRLFNASDEPIADAQAWVNGRYMLHVDRLGPHGMIQVHPGDFLSVDRAEMPWGERVERVEVLVGEKALRRAALVIE
jgi:hypothetical protein